MNFIFATIFCLALFVKNVHCQALADSKSNYINFYKEMLYPAFRRHRGRIRPNHGNRGSPINKIRGSRSTEKKSSDSDNAECVYYINSLICSGFNSKSSKISFQCDADIDSQLGSKILVGNIKINPKDYSKISSSVQNYKMKFIIAIGILCLSQVCHGFLIPPIIPPALLVAHPLLARNLLLSSLLIGKREILPPIEDTVESSDCEYTIGSSVLECKGLNETIKCDVTERLNDLPKFDSTIKDLFLVRKNETDASVLSIISEETEFTFTRPDTQDEISLSVYNSEDINLPGLLITDQECWNQVEKMYEESSFVSVNLNL
ncbi:hypothetical protein BpHYR1_036212 [Brachionus plicatilis]|uniref:Uncharacterized protein n=1 Tax=Brachionus plicatilis TaxID=10195 RepID=A0A3M7S3V9_BRAPC|nr:hypothetical protein BpHYR1_036212 [Brachionus plicatilis]